MCDVCGAEIQERDLAHVSGLLPFDGDRFSEYSISYDIHPECLRIAFPYSKPVKVKHNQYSKFKLFVREVLEEL